MLASSAPNFFITAITQLLYNSIFITYTNVFLKLYAIHNEFIDF